MQPSVPLSGHLLPPMCLLWYLRQLWRDVPERHAADAHIAGGDLVRHPHGPRAEGEPATTVALARRRLEAAGAT